LLLADQRERWRSGEPIPVEAYLAEMAALQADVDAILDLVCNEVVLRGQKGESPNLEDYVQRLEAYARQFPQLPSQLRYLFEVEGAIEAASESKVATEDYPTLPSGESRTCSNPVATPVSARVGSYELLGELGRGAMGVVYKVRQTGLNRIAAVKMILAGAHAGQSELLRFRTEAEAVARLQHPNIVQVYEVGEQEGRPYFSLEFVDGGSLARKLAGTPQGPRQAAELVHTLARAMHYAHQRGIIHRDLKPANVLLTIDGTPKITDFGLAKRLDDGPRPPGSDNPTRTGDIMGTPSYMAPEQASGKNHLVGQATDIYALGAILYELLTGRPPFRGATSVETLQQVVFDELVPPSRLQPRVPRDLETICLKCLEKEIAKRYAGAQDLAEDLRRFLAGEAILARRTGFWERGVKWARRRPLVAGLSLGLILALTIGPALVILKWRDAVAALATARQETRRAGKAEDVALRRLYAAHMNDAYSNWQKLQLDQVSKLLAEQQPATPDEKDLRGFEWYFLNRLCHSALLSFPGEKCGVAFSPDGHHVASGGDDNVIIIRDADTGKEVRRLGGHEGAPTCVAFSPDGRYLASGGSDSTVRIWDLGTGQVQFTLKSHKGPINCVTFSPDSRQVASAGEDKTVRIWDALKGRPILTFHGHTRSVHCVAFHPNGKSLASGGTDESLLIWDSEGHIIHLFPGRHKRCVSGLAFSPDGKSLASAGWDGAIKVSELAGQQPGPDANQQIFSGHSREVTSIAFSPDGKYIASGSWDHTVRIWESATGHELRVLQGHSREVHSVAYHPDSRRVASAGFDSIVNVWDATADQEVRTLEGHAALVSCVAFSPDDSRLASAGFDKTVRIWDPTSGKLVLTLAGHDGRVNSLAYSPDGRYIASAGDDKTVRVWDAATHRAPVVLSGHAAAVLDVAFSPDGGQIASAGADSVIKIWDAESGRELFNLKGHTDGVMSVIYSPDGRHLASAGGDASLRIWDLATGRESFTLNGHNDAVLAVEYSPDGRLLATAGKDHTARIWDGETGKQVFTLTGHTGTVQALAFSPDGRRLATVSYDKTVKIWDTFIGQETLTLLSSPTWNQACGVAFSHDGQHLAVSGGKFRRGEIKIWGSPRPR
jgi:WD40 repeat protein